MAGEILDRLSTLMGNRTDDGMFNTSPVFEEDIFNRMYRFIVSLEPEQLTEEQASTIIEMIDDIELEYEDIDEELDEIKARRVKRDKGAKRERARTYRKTKSKRKREAKRYRKSARGKMMAKKSKRMKKRGKTATGKRIRHYTN